MYQPSKFKKQITPTYSWDTISKFLHTIPWQDRPVSWEFSRLEWSIIIRDVEKSKTEIHEELGYCMLAVKIIAVSTMQIVNTAILKRKAEERRRMTRAYWQPTPFPIMIVNYSDSFHASYTIYCPSHPHMTFTRSVLWNGHPNPLHFAAEGKAHLEAAREDPYQWFRD